MQYVNLTLKSSYNKDDIYIFHGTQGLMHTSGQKEFMILSFLSCSFNIYISIDYSKALLSFSNRKGIIYVFKVKVLPEPAGPVRKTLFPSFRISNASPWVISESQKVYLFALSATDLLNLAICSSLSGIAI